MLVSPNFLVVVGDCTAEERYTDTLKAIGAAFVRIKTPEELKSLPKNTKYCGIMVDSDSFERLSPINQATIQEHALVLPTVKLDFDPETGDLKINTLSFEGVCTESIEDFVKSCATFPARSLRCEPRYNIELSVMLGDYLTLITDISKSGCYIFTIDNTLQPGDKIEFSSTDLGGQTPIVCLIRRKNEWENEGLEPGIGVDFLTMTKAQEKNLDALLSRCVKKS